jgi:hypothetical protein
MAISRRQFIKNISLLTATFCCSKPLYATTNDLPKYCSLQGGLSANGIKLLSTSGNSDIDRSINLELIHLAQSFNVLPGFGFFDDSHGKNAFAMPDTVIANTQGTLVFGKYLLAEELASSTWGGLAVAGIMAHEFGHVYQFQSQLYQVLNKAQNTHKLSELHADYLAGYYLGLKRLRTGEIDIKAFLDSLYIKGDTDFNNPSHHGTPLERKDAMLAGYKIGLTNNTDINQVAQWGINVVTTL